MKKIVMFGICGRMGTAISRKLIMEKDLELCAGYDVKNIDMDLGKYLAGEENGKKIYGSYGPIAEIDPDIIIDFTVAGSAVKNILWAIDNHIDIIVGTTGLGARELNDIEKKANKKKSRVFVVPNFSIGAVLMMKVSGLIAGYFDNCEIIEMHHDQKKDAPSGTSIATARSIESSIVFNRNRLIEGEEEVLEGSRGAFTGGVHIHSIRLPGLLAHQQVVFGTTGQTLIIRHDSLDRSSFYPGVVMAINHIDEISYYACGLESVIKIPDSGG